MDLSALVANRFPGSDSIGVKVQSLIYRKLILAVSHDRHSNSLRRTVKLSQHVIICT